MSISVSNDDFGEDSSEVSATLEHKDGICDVTWSPSGRLTAASADGTVSLWEVRINCGSFWMCFMWLWQRVMPSLSYMHRSCFKKSRVQKRGKTETNQHKKQQKNQSMRRSPEPKNQSSYSLYFLRQDQFPTTQIPFTIFFLGSFSDSDFPAKPWMVSFSCVGLANVAAITLLCRAFLRRVLSLGCNIWQFTAFETNTEEAEANQGWVSFSMTWISMEFLHESTAYLTSRLPAFYVTFMCFNAWCVQAFWTPNTGYPTVRNACEWSVWASNICALGGSIVSACCFCTVWIKQKSGMVLAFWTCSFYWVIFIYILLWQL